ncbi:MAG: hypothetical protein OSA99_15225 [Acidimicrobiales bacterium]|nr:hypothetical protein [Acidimicrobiales bacterium]
MATVVDVDVVESALVLVTSDSAVPEGTVDEGEVIDVADTAPESSSDPQPRTAMAIAAIPIIHVPPATRMPRILAR